MICVTIVTNRRTHPDIKANNVTSHQTPSYDIIVYQVLFWITAWLCTAWWFVW